MVSSLEYAKSTPRSKAPSMIASEASASPSAGTLPAGKEPEGKILFDYRRPHHGTAELSESEERRIVEAVVKAGFWEELDEKVWVNSAFSGSFSKRGARETAYLLQPGGPRAMEAHSTASTALAVFSGKRLVVVAGAEGTNFIVHAMTH